MKKLTWITAGALLLSITALILLLIRPLKADSALNTDSTYAAVETLNIDSQAASEKSGSKTIVYRSSDGQQLWRAVLKGSFLYDGSTSVCTASACTVTFYDKDWYTASNVTNISGNTAEAELVTAFSILGLDVDQKSCSITLTCDPDGNLS